MISAPLQRDPSGHLDKRKGNMKLMPRQVGCEDEHFSQGGKRASPEVGLYDAIVSWRAKGRDFMISENSFDSEKVKSVTDGYDSREMVLFQKFNGFFNALAGCQAAGLSEDAVLRNILPGKIKLAHASFGVPRVETVSPGGHDLTGVALFEER